MGIFVRKSIKMSILQMVTVSAWASQALAEPKGTGSATAEAMVVTGTRSTHDSWDTAIPTDSISIEDARKRGKQNLADVLAELPGVEVVPAIRGQTVRLQGFDSKYVLVLIDGQRVSGKVGETFDLESISVEQMERVEIVRGAASSLYGSDGIGGVVNVILRRPRTNRQDLRLRWGTDAEKAIGGQASFVGKDTDSTLSLNLSQQDPWRRSQSPATSFSGTEIAEIAWLHHAKLPAEWSFKTRLGYQSTRIDGTDVSGAGAIWDRENRIQRSTVQVGPEKRFENGSILKLDMQLQNYKDDYRTVARLQKSEKTQEKTHENIQEHTLSYQHEVGLAHLLTWGATHITETLESDRLQSDSVARKRNSFFAQDEWSPLSDLTLVPGFRLDDDSQFGDKTSGKLALRYAWNENTIIRPSYGEGYRAPAFKELYLRFENLAVGYDVIGNSELKPETSRSYQLALDHRLSLEKTLTAHVFRNDLDDMILATALKGEGQGVMHYTYKNIARARTQGVDLTFRWAGASADTTVRYQYLEARDRTVDQPLEGRSRDTLAAQINRLDVLDDLRLQASARWMGPQFYTVNEETQKTKAALVVNAGILYDWTANWSGSLGIDNLTNSWEDRILQIRPRSYIVTLNWNHQNERKD